METLKNKIDKLNRLTFTYIFQFYSNHRVSKNFTGMKISSPQAIASKLPK